MEYRENNHDDNGKVFIPADTERRNLPATTEVEQFVAQQVGGNWKASGGWHPTGDNDEVYIQVAKV